ncbi:MAG: DUF1588 domain-containing protein [Myxococcota bacterium]|nr:DUF1588 domain-containing protein [Myxococcota bacterium]
MGKGLALGGGIGIGAALLALFGSGCGPVDGELEGDGVDGESVGSVSQALDPSFVASAGGARRLMSRHYLRAIEEILGPQAAAAATPPKDPSTGGVDAIAARELPIDPDSVQVLEISAFSAAAAAANNLATLATQAGAPCVNGPYTASARNVCYGQVAQRVANSAWRIPPTATQKAKLVQIGTQGETGTTDLAKFRGGLTTLLATILQAPNFIYSVEVGTPIAGSQNRTLNPFELATRMSLFLTGRIPSADLLSRAGSGQLSTDAGIRAAATSLLGTATAREGFRDHIDEMFEVNALLAKGKAGLTAELKASMAEEVRRFAESFVFDNPRSFMGILTEETRAIDQNLASLYGVSVSSDWAPFNFATGANAQQRAGIMTTPALMTVFSHPTLNSPTRRGLFIRERMLCDSVSPPGPGIDTTPKAPDFGKTLRQRMEEDHAVGGCNFCHGSMDPLGFAFEMYGTLGDYRTQDNNQPLDLTGDLDGAAYDGPRQLMSILAQPANQVSSCWIRQLYRSAIGIKEATPQESALTDLDTAFSAAGYSMRQLLIEMVASPAFRQVGPLR